MYTITEYKNDRKVKQLKKTFNSIQDCLAYLYEKGSERKDYVLKNTKTRSMYAVYLSKKFGHCSAQNIKTGREYIYK